MACLDTTSKSLTIELTGSPTTQVQWTVHYATRSGTDFTESSNDGVTNSTTPVTMIAAPSSGETISIRDITVYNADVSSVTIVIKLVNGGNSRVLYRQALDTLESWSSLAQKGKDGSQGLTGSVSAASGLILDESSAPNTATNQGALYVPVADNLLRYRGESNGTERRIALIDTTNLATNDLFYYGSDGLFKSIGIGTLDQVLLAKPSSNPPYQWATPVYREVLTANRTYYVRTDGNDSNNGLADTSGGAFLTIQKAVDIVSTLDQSIYTATIQVGAGTFTQTITLPFTLGKCVLKGNTTTLTNCVINTSSFCIIVLGDKWKVEGFSLTSSTTQCIRVDSGVLEVGNLRFAGGSIGIRCFNGGKVFGSTIVGAVAITATGSFTQLFYISRGAIDAFGWAFTFTSLTVSSPAFQLDDLGYMRLTSATFTGSFTGTRYNLAGNSVLQTGGQATTWIPGTVSGVLATGGQYI